MRRALWGAMVLLWLAAPAAAQTAGMSPEPLRAAMFIKAKEYVAQGDWFGAFASVENAEDPFVVASRYDQLVDDFYWKDGDATAVVRFGQAGLDYCRRAIAEVGHRRDGGKSLRIVAASIAFKVARYTWPGWAREGVTVSDTDRAMGLAAARLNVRLAREAGMPHESMANANWLLGGHLLAEKRYTEAVSAFRAGAESAAKGGNVGIKLFCEGMIGVADIAAGRADSGERAYAQARAAMDRLPANEAKELLGRLDNARAVFAPAAAE